MVDLSPKLLDAIVDTARRQLRRNLGPGMRRTTSSLSPQRLAVYGRTGRPCLRCGSAIRRRSQGEQARASYWCPACQRLGRAGR